MAEIKTVGVIGAGQMGSGIAHVCALAGYDVLLNDLSSDRISESLTLIDHNMTRQVSRGIVDEADARAAMSRIRPEPALEAVGKTDLAIEAATEDESIKKKIFAALTPHLGPATLLASNTS